MQRYVLKKRLPACFVARGFLQQLEAYLDRQVNQLFGKRLSRMKELYGHQDLSQLKNLSIQIHEEGKRSEYSSATNIPGDHLPQKIDQLRMVMRFGQPELLSVQLSFHRHARPTLEVSTLRKDQQKTCQLFADGIFSLLKNWTNHNATVASRPVLLGTALALPVGISLYGWWKNADLFSLLASQGWLLILSIGLAFSLQRLFPLVRFRTGQRFDFKRFFWLIFLSVLVALAMGYSSLLLLHLGLTNL